MSFGVPLAYDLFHLQESDRFLYEPRAAAVVHTLIANCAQNDDICLATLERVDRRDPNDFVCGGSAHVAHEE